MKLTPAAATLISSCPGPGTGGSTEAYSRTSGPPGSLATMACVMVAPYSGTVLPVPGSRTHPMKDAAFGCGGLEASVRRSHGAVEATSSCQAYLVEVADYYPIGLNQRGFRVWDGVLRAELADDPCGLVKLGRGHVTEQEGFHLTVQRAQQEVHEPSA